MTAQPNHSERAHAVCSASGAERGLACLGSVAMCAMVPQNESSIFAKEGTQAHELADKIKQPLVTAWNQGKDIWDSSKMMDYSPWEHYPREMWEHVIEYVRLIWDNVRTYKPKKIFIEQRVVFDQSLGMFGTSDCFFGFKQENKKILSVWDFKYGKKHAVEASSPQLKYYAAAILCSIGVRIDEAWLNIYQPRADHEAGPHRMMIEPFEELQKWGTKFLQWGVEAPALIGKPIEEIEKYLTFGEHCIFCDGKVACPAYKKKLNEEAGMDFMDDPDLLPSVEDANKIISYFKENPEQAAKLLAALPRIEKFCSAFKQSSINYFMSGGDIPGWKLVEGRSQRQWKKEPGVGDGLIKLGVKDPYDRKLRGLGSIETELKANGMKAKQAKEAISSLVVMSTPPVSLAPASDSRPAISGHEQAVLDFADVGNDEVD